MDAPILDDTEVSDRSPSETPDIAGDLGRNTGDIQLLHVCSHVRRDEETSLLAGLDTLFVSVYHPMFSNFDSEFVLERADPGVPGDEIVVSPKIFRESDFEQDIGHCDEVGIAWPFGHHDVASGEDCVELIPRMTWFAAS